jgi:hypothetical protein
MNATPMTTIEPACLGVVCPAHEHCARYYAAEGAPLRTIGTCVDGQGARPLFVELRKGMDGLQISEVTT